MTQYNDKTYLMATKAECYRRCRNAPLRVSELMKAVRVADAGQRFRQWLHQQGRLAALNEIYACEIDGQRPRLAQLKSFSAALDSPHMNEEDPSGEYFRGYQTIALDYLSWLKTLPNGSEEAT